MSKQETPIIGLNESVFFDSIEFELRDGVGDSTVVHQINNLVNNLSLAQSLYSRGQNRYIEYVKSLTKSFRPIAGVREIEFNKLTLNVEDARTLKDQVAPALDSITAGDEKVASWTFVAAGLLNSLENHPQSRSIGQGGRKEDVSAHAREAITQAKSKVIKYLNETWDPDPENNWIDLTARYGKRASPAIPVILAACVAPAMETSIETVTAREGVGAESTATAQALIK